MSLRPRCHFSFCSCQARRNKSGRRLGREGHSCFGWVFVCFTSSVHPSLHLVPGSVLRPPLSRRLLLKVIQKSESHQCSLCRASRAGRNLLPVLALLKHVSEVIEDQLHLKRVLRIGGSAPGKRVRMYVLRLSGA